MTTALAVHDLRCSYGRRPILDGLSFTVREGEFFIIIGPNGSGKTTLARTIAGSIRPVAGRVEIFGRPLQSYSGKALAKCLALVPQAAPPDIPFSVAEVVLMGRSPYLGLLAVETGRDLEIAEHAMEFTRVRHLAGSRLDRLSGGECQRVLIARAVCQQPRLLVLDEPTSFLDLAHQSRVMDLLERLRKEKGTTILMVSHDLNLAAMYADRLLLLKEGKKAGIGPPNEVLTREMLERTYGCDLVIDKHPTRDVPRISLVRGEE